MNYSVQQQQRLVIEGKRWRKGEKVMKKKKKKKKQRKWLHQRKKEAAVVVVVMESNSKKEWKSRGRPFSESESESESFFFFFSSSFSLSHLYASKQLNLGGCCQLSHWMLKTLFLLLRVWSYEFYYLSIPFQCQTEDWWVFFSIKKYFCWKPPVAFVLLFIL